MQTRHIPRIDRRYWFGILLASIFGTNLGDFYAHESGLGLGLGLLVLCILFAATCWIEAKDRMIKAGAVHELYYWLAIIIIRTGATNIADALAYRARVPGLLLASGLAVCIATLAWRGSAQPKQGELATTNPTLARTDLTYWATMLAAGVFGTVAGDISSHHVGQGPASLGLGLMLALVLVAAKSRVAVNVAVYWGAVALARTAGTAMGDWLAETRTLHIGLPLSTLVTGAAFLALLTCWRSAQPEAPAAA